MTSILFVNKLLTIHSGSKLWTILTLCVMTDDILLFAAVGGGCVPSAARHLHTGLRPCVPSPDCPFAQPFLWPLLCPGHNKTRHTNALLADVRRTPARWDARYYFPWNGNINSLSWFCAIPNLPCSLFNPYFPFQAKMSWCAKVQEMDSLISVRTQASIPGRCSSCSSFTSLLVTSCFSTCSSLFSRGYHIYQ